jgi:hypothetical protein
MRYRNWQTISAMRSDRSISLLSKLNKRAASRLYKEVCAGAATAIFQPRKTALRKMTTAFSPIAHVSLSTKKVTCPSSACSEKNANSASICTLVILPLLFFVYAVHFDFDFDNASITLPPFKENTENEASEQINPHLPVASVGTSGHPEIGALTDGECLANDRQPKDEVTATALSNILNCRRGQ